MDRSPHPASLLPRRAVLPAYNFVTQTDDLAPHAQGRALPGTGAAASDEKQQCSFAWEAGVLSASARRGRSPPHAADEVILQRFQAPAVRNHRIRKSTLIGVVSLRTASAN